MSCGCGKPNTTNYVGKEVLFKGNWYSCITQDRMSGALGITYNGGFLWIRISRVEGIR